MDDLILREDLTQYVVHAGPHPLGDGYIMRLKFPNGFGASIIRTSFSYGNEDGLFEVAVIKYDNDEWHLTYDTEVTDDVIGNLSVEEVIEVLYHIKILPIGHSKIDSTIDVL